jgi:hypothetical protein
MYFVCQSPGEISIPNAVDLETPCVIVHLSTGLAAEDSNVQLCSLLLRMKFDLAFVKTVIVQCGLHVTARKYSSDMDSSLNHIRGPSTNSGN